MHDVLNFLTFQLKINTAPVNNHSSLGYCQFFWLSIIFKVMSDNHWKQRTETILANMDKNVCALKEILKKKQHENQWQTWNISWALLNLTVVAKARDTPNILDTEWRSLPQKQLQKPTKSCWPIGHWKCIK